MTQIFPFERHQLSRQSLLKNLPDDAAEILMRNQDVIVYKRGQMLFHEGTQPLGLYYIRQGKVKVYCQGYEGKEHIFYVCREHELLGHHAILSDEALPDSAAALETSEVVFIPKEDFLEAVRKSPDFHMRITKNLAHEFGFFVNSSKILSQFSVRERTALALLILNDKYRMGEMSVEIDMSREDLSNIVGTAKETVVRILKDFKEEGLIKTKGRLIRISDEDALARISHYYF